MENKNPYPKIWGLGNPGVGRGAQRHLGRPFQTHAGGGAIARNKGKFSEIMIEPEGGDGWFSTGTNQFAPFRLRGSPSPRVKFSKRGNLPAESGLTLFSTGLMPSGNGWAYVTQFVNSSGGIAEYTVNKSYDGGRSVLELFPFIFALPTENVGVSAYFFPAYFDALTFASSIPVYVTQDINRQHPQIRLFFKDGTDWVFADVPMMEDFFEENEDYTFSPFNTQIPGNFVAITSKFGEKPVLFVTFDLGTNWGGYDMDIAGFFPDIDWPVLTYPTQASAPGADAEERRENFLDQDELLVYFSMAHSSIDVLSLRRVIITTPPYPKIGGGYRITTTVFDIVNGIIEEQFWDDVSIPEIQVVFNTPIGENSFIHHRLEFDGPPPPTVPDQDWDGEVQTEVTTDGGATLVPFTAESELRLINPIVGAARPDEEPPIWPNIYYVIRTGTNARELWMSDDLFDTSNKQSTVAPPGAVAYNNDFNSVEWIGTPGPTTAAPCDPCVPWRVDTRFAVPSWWYDGLPEP